MTESEIAAVVKMHAVYRMYDRTGRLLYVGVTGSLGKRLDDHAEKRWFPLVRDIRLEWFPDRSAAEDAESAAIRDEGPEYNVAGAVLELRRRRAAARQRQQRLRAQSAAWNQAQVRDEMTINDAFYAGVFGNARLETVRRYAHRRGLQPVSRDGLAWVYRLEDLKGLAR